MPEGPLESPGYHLWRAALRWKDAVKDALAPHDLTPTQFFVLGAAGWLSRTSPPKQRDIAEFAGLDLMTTSQVVRALEKAGLVVRADDPDDARSWLVLPSDAGRRVLKEAASAVRAADNAFFASIGGRREAFMSALASLHHG